MMASLEFTDLAAEFLLQLPDEPDVDFPKGLAQPVRHVDHHRLPGPVYVHLAATKPTADHTSPTTPHYTKPNKDKTRWSLTTYKAELI